MRVLVFGAGAVGSALGARLDRPGTDLLLVGRSAHVKAIQSGGLQVDGLPGNPHRIPATDHLAEGSEFDRIVLTVKANDIEGAAGTIARTVLHPVPLLAIQNGLGIRPRLVRALSLSGWPFARRWVTRGIGIVPATYVEPAHVRIGGEWEVLLSRAAEVGGLNGFDALLEAAGVPVRLVESIDREEWKKALVNAAVNPVTADLGIENGRLASDPFRGQALHLLHEAREVAAAEGFDIPAAEAEEELFRIVRASAPNRSSMLQDLDAGRPTEIEAISGAVLELGKRHGLRLPHTERAVRRIRAKAAGRPTSRSGPSARM